MEGIVLPEANLNGDALRLWVFDVKLLERYKRHLMDLQMRSSSSSRQRPQIRVKSSI
jgi:hypothetical protein